MENSWELIRIVYKDHNRRYRGIVLVSLKIVVDLFTIYFQRLS